MPANPKEGRVQPRFEPGQRQLHHHPAAFDPGEAERSEALTCLHLVDVRVQLYSFELRNSFGAEGDGDGALDNPMVALGVIFVLLLERTVHQHAA